jgi:hypothetical protein
MRSEVSKLKNECHFEVLTVFFLVITSIVDWHPVGDSLGSVGFGEKYVGSLTGHRYQSFRSV